MNPYTAPPPPTRVNGREGWLREVARRLAEWPELPALPPFRVGVGFTSKGARSNRIGECWAPTCTPDNTCELFIHPGLGDATTVAATLAHELIHAAVGVEAKHGPKFKRVALALGLQGKMTATTAGPRFVERITPILEEVGPYPHGQLRAVGAKSTGPKQTTRMLKCECPECGYTVRTTRKWLDVAVPRCPVCEDQQLAVEVKPDGE
jgi:hypothetical protein